MALEPFSSTDLFNFIIYDTISASCDPPPALTISDFSASQSQLHKGSSAVQGRRKKRRRRARTSCKNRQEAEKQRMTHIAVERNRRKQMNEHLSVLRSLMPHSYVQKGDQASIVGGAIQFVKELEQLVHSLEAEKLLQRHDHEEALICSNTTSSSSSPPLIFSHDLFLMNIPEQQQQFPSKFRSKCCRTGIADIEVTLIETHANLRILSRKIPRQLSKLVNGLHSLCLTILHINVTTINPLILYSISAKVEEGCQLNSADDITESVHNMLKIIEEEGSCLVSIA